MSSVLLNFMLLFQNQYIIVLLLRSLYNPALGYLDYNSIFLAYFQAKNQNRIEVVTNHFIDDIDKSFYLNFIFFFSGLVFLSGIFCTIL